MRAWSRRLIAIGLAVAVTSGAAWIGLLAARIGEGSSLAALEDAASTLLTQTQFGAAWQLRLVLALVLAAGLWRKPAADPSRVSQGIAIAVSAMFVGTLAWSGHGAATPGDAGYFHLVADVLHLIAAAIWLGGLVPLVMLLRWTIPTIDEYGMAVQFDVLRRYSNLGLAAVATLVATGIVNVWFIPGSADAILASDYGHLLLVKLALFAIMAMLAAVNRLKLLPGLMSAQADRALSVTRRIQAHALAEIVLGVVIILLVGWLGIMVPGMPSAPHVH